MDPISHEDITKIVEIAGKAVPGDLKIPENDRFALMGALAKLKMSFQTPVEGTIEVAAGVQISVHSYSLKTLEIS